MTPPRPLQSCVLWTPDRTSLAEAIKQLQGVNAVWGGGWYREPLEKVFEWEARIAYLQVDPNGYVYYSSSGQKGDPLLTDGSRSEDITQFECPFGDFPDVYTLMQLTVDDE